jgi:hypothetical protein
MARGFDSKSVSDQQEEALRRAERRAEDRRPGDPRRKTLEMSRTDVRHRLDAARAAGNERLVMMLSQALDHVEGELRRMDAPPTVPARR